MAKGEQITWQQAVQRTHVIDTPVPHISDPLNKPLHMREGIASNQTSILDHTGRPIVGKTGDNKFIAHQSEILGPKGDPMRIVPVYSDRIATGQITLPYSQKQFEVHGGNGFGTKPGRYGKMAWAVGHDPSVGYTSPSQAGRAWSKSVTDDARGPGVIGAVWLGSHFSHAGNVTLPHALMHELEFLRQNDPIHYAQVNEGFRKIPEYYASQHIKEHLGHPVNQWPDFHSFLQHISGERMSMQARGNIMAELLKKEIKDPATLTRKARTADADGFAFISFLRRVNDSLLDHHHVPQGHVLSLVRFHGDGMYHDQHTHPAYKFILPGSYVGELQHTVPLADLFPSMRMPPPEGKPPITGIFIQHNPYHERLVADPNVFLNERTLRKAIRVGRDGVSEFDPDAVNWYLYKRAMKPEVQRRAVHALMRAVQED